MDDQQNMNEAADGRSALTAELGLKPRPFCGGTPEMLRKGNDFTKKRSITIKCRGCRAERTDSALRNGMAWLEGVAVENWNQRPNVI